jgi:hypothetical protein
MLEKVLRGVASWCWPYLAPKPSHVRVDVDRSACPLHRPTIRSYPMRGQDLMSGATLSCRVVGGIGVFSG